MPISSDDLLSKIQEKIRSLIPKEYDSHDPFSFIVDEKALATAKEGNFGIGVCFARKETGEVILKDKH